MYRIYFSYVYIFYKLYHIFILTIACHIEIYSLSVWRDLCNFMLQTTCFIDMITNIF